MGYFLNNYLESHLGIHDTSWRALNSTWGCTYRIKNGFLSINIMSALSSATTAGQEYTLGTIPLANLGITSVPYVIVPGIDNAGILLVKQNGEVHFRPKVATQWYYAFVTIPVD